MAGGGFDKSTTLTLPQLRTTGELIAHASALQKTVDLSDAELEREMRCAAVNVVTNHLKLVLEAAERLGV